MTSLLLLLVFLTTTTNEAKWLRDINVNINDDHPIIIPEQEQEQLKSTNVAASARWLVSSTDMGVLSTVNPDTKIPFGNVVSFSDGINSQQDRRNATGTPYFFLTTMDATARNVRHNPGASFTISGKWDQIDGRCGALDAQEPPCARITLSGVVHVVLDPKERELAHQALFSKHPAMSRWPSSHAFDLYKLEVQSIFFLNNYGGAPSVSIHDYFAASPVNH